MILMLRHMALCLWISTILGLPLVFWALPMVNGFFPDHDLLAAFFILVMVVGIIEYAMNLVGVHYVQGELRSAESWDRAGITKKSERHYLKALERYERGLISPFRSKRVALLLLPSLAKFSLTSAIPHSAFEKAVETFLHIFPQDEEIAFLWLKRVGQKKNMGRQEHEILTRIAEAHLDHPRIRALCTEVFVASGRTDFTAQKIYKTVQEPYDPGRETLWEMNHNYFQKRESLSSRILLAIKNKPKQLLVVLKTGFTFLSGFNKFTTALRSNVLKFNFFKSNVLKWGVVILVGAVFTGFAINTLSHLFHTPPPPTVEVNNRVVVEIPRRFTIQVAAYLKKNHAEDYVEKLKAKGLEAYIYKADGGGRTWFIVRISRFSDKESAAAYGTRLKQQQLIDDFFVDNNE